MLGCGWLVIGFWVGVKSRILSKMARCSPDNGSIILHVFERDYGSQI